ncbi:HET-domain-containing protein [Ophiobolus disseminans]|uniref:HET-domain-containing protein n=1 Tax=Ophiobolus disseminans TaxID=1469910 RepID=A0A6A6ZIY1_9PLEO|nr:HET-domain-containing protein [Ophiobolus disseminans]
MKDDPGSNVFLPTGLIDSESVRRPPGQYHRAKRQQKGNIGGEEFCAPCASAIYDGDFRRIGTASWLNDGFEDCEHLDKPVLYCCLCKHLIRARELARRAGTVDTRSYNVELSWHLPSMEAGIFVHDDGADLDEDSDSRLDGFEVEKCYYTRSINRNWANISIIKHWLGNCEVKHGPACNAHRHDMVAGSSSLLLVDVENDCLVQGRFTDRYFALSYVWGASKQFLTRVGNYKSLLEHGSLSAQPITQTIRDSMTSIKSLGERYLWVDTVCIIQDDASNKATAIQQMSSIYSCAVATIICLSGSSANAGLPGILPTARNASAVPIAPGLSIVERTPLERMLNEHSYGTDEYVYNSRAWTFQERLLSNRSIMFSNEQVYFQCNKELLCEDRYGKDYSDSALFTLEKARVWSSTNKAREKPYSPLEEFRWYEEIVSEYTAKRMGYPADIINAFTGVQTQLSKMFDWSFRVGLPEPLLDLALLWTPLESTERRATGFDHPSWSWAGWVGRVHYKDLVRPLHLPIGQAFHALTSLKVNTDNLQTLRFSGETVQLSAFNLSKCQQRLSNSHYSVQVTPHTHFLFDQQNRRCGILHGLQDSHGNNHIQPNAPMILLRLSHWKRVNAPYKHGPVIAHLNDSQYEINEDLFDKTFADMEWCTLNFMCVKWWGAGWYRVGVGQMHKEAWRQAKVLRQSVGVQ